MIVDEIRKMVEEACKSSKNFFGYDIWAHHILSVVKYANLLAKKVGADEEIVEIAALLHDYASIKNHKLYEEHHIHGAGLAGQILKKYNYQEEKVERVKHCILSHRGSKSAKKLTKEAICVADADAMAHFDSITSLFYLVFSSHKMNVKEAEDWLMQKLERSWNKMSPRAREIVKDKYEVSKILFSAQR